MLGRVALAVVAIGGLTPENVAPVVATGVPLVAMISALDRFETVADLQRFMAHVAEMSPPIG
jgi:thiamine monophosphate synthase